MTTPFIQSGILHVDQPPGDIGPHLDCRTFAETPLGKAAAMKLDGLRTRFILPHCTIRGGVGQDFELTIAYSAQKLDRLELFLILPTDGKSWSDWSEANEKKRKQAAESWAAELLGHELTIKPMDLDGQSITPIESTWDLPRHAQLPWGELLSFYDSKAGSPGILIQYAG